MDRNRILELALEELQHQKAGIEADIEAVRAELRNTGTAVRQTIIIPSASTRRKRTAAERKASSFRMKQIWAARRAKAVKPATAPKKSAPAKARTMTDAQKKALSLKMKEAWKKRKAAAAEKKTTA